MSEGNSTAAATSTAPVDVAQGGTSLEEVEWSVNDPDPIEPEGTDPRAQPTPGKPDQKLKGEPSKPLQDPNQAASKKKLTVQGKEYELDDESRDRWAQKGIYYEKRGYELAQQKKQLEGFAQEAAQTKAQAEQFLNAVKQDPIGALVQLLGDENAVREQLEGYLGPRVRQEMEEAENPHLKAIREANARAEMAERRAKQFEHQEQQKAHQAQVDQLRGQYVKQIIGILESNNIPKNERSVKLAADYLHAAESRKLQVSPEQVAQHVREEYIEGIQELGKDYLTQAKEARKANDQNRLVQIGKAVKDFLGDDLALVIRMADLAELKSRHSSIPQAIVETPRTQHQPTQSKGNYMDWDQWKDESKKRAEALQRGESVDRW